MPSWLSGRSCALLAAAALLLTLAAARARAQAPASVADLRSVPGAAHIAHGELPADTMAGIAFTDSLRIASYSSRADTVPGRDSVAEEPGAVALVLGDLEREASSPFHMSREHGLHLCGGIVVGTGLLLMDRAIDSRMRPLRDESGWIGTLSPIVTQLGGTAGFAGVGVFVGYSLFFGDHYDRRTSRLLAEAIVTSTVWTRSLKFLAGRRRPATMYAEGYDAGAQWLGALQAVRNPDRLPASYFESFPSGHATTAFAIATVFARRYGNTPAVPVIAYSLATLVGISRIVEHQHWASDVFVGACIGYLCGMDVTDHSSDAAVAGGPARSDRLRFRLYPAFTAGAPGIGFSAAY